MNHTINCFWSLKSVARMVRIPGKLTTIFAILFLLSGCQTESKSDYALVKIYGNGSVGNITKSWLMVSTFCHVGQPGGLMASPGDMFFLEGWMVLNTPDIKNSKGEIHFVGSDSVLLINGKLAGIGIDTSVNFREMLDLKDAALLKQIKVIAITPEGLKQYGKEVEMIASVNPDCFLQLPDSFSDSELKMLFDLFNPDALWINLKTNQQPLLASEPQLKTLYIANDDSLLECKPLPSLPNLKNLVSYYNGNEINQSPDNRAFLINNPQIEKLVMPNWEGDYPSGMLEPLTRPTELFLDGSDSLPEEILAFKKSLNRVWIDSLMLQTELPNLKWATIANSDDPQQLLNKLAELKPDIEVLEIFADEDPLDITPIEKFKHLKALTLVDADSIDLKPLFNMKQLQLLSYSTRTSNIDSGLTQLRTALPNTLVVANDGLCLGSGWLMLTLPAMVIAGLLAYRARRKQAYHQP